METSSRLKFYYAISKYLIEDWLDPPDMCKVDLHATAGWNPLHYTYKKRRRHCIVCKCKV
jgi:hypothetical protein